MAIELKDKLAEAAALLKVLERYTPKHDGVTVDVVISFDGNAEMRLSSKGGDHEEFAGYGLATY